METPQCLTIHEIEKKYPDEWVLLDKPETDEATEVRGGILMFHSKERREISAEIKRLKLKEWAVLYTGGPPKGVTMML